MKDVVSAGTLEKTRQGTVWEIFRAGCHISEQDRRSTLDPSHPKLLPSCREFLSPMTTYTAFSGVHNLRLCDTVYPQARRLSSVVVSSFIWPGVAHKTSVWYFSVWILKGNVRCAVAVVVSINIAATRSVAYTWRGDKRISVTQTVFCRRFRHGISTVDPRFSPWS